MKNRTPYSCPTPSISTPFPSSPLAKSCPSGEGDSWTSPLPRSTFLTSYHLGLQSCPPEAHLCAWIGEDCILQSCCLHTTHKRGHLSKETAQPKAQMNSLFGDSTGWGGSPSSKTHLLSVAGGSLEVAEERPGLSDHRQQGRRLLEGQREEARGRNGNSDMERDRVRGRKKERNFSVEQ